ncbi:hypothetical protein YPPY47_2591 [Yersinia pestis PY-47]|nr:hypothetical protein YPPY01_2438 [Yersinia pestis PY-01]EIR31896.1 hypothetical protein YPPY10_2548 [Yersinia pestis PY-10]EIR33972.1 hypothetical protein YPPY12_2652 [Yersinia pestis PY-12]EIR60086.1 hypothetical protein YPPY16_2525 [Yersinia pestis PY-16]EIR64922.1 hypothetical protein YPPY25_2518 [Yersinia pestis PY-25]EIR77603.1 hypothetical protein YPPY32_2773 [Yersinia pestis PY-32]EIS04928.1 hypothetical protein YPPY47_2591 [Yersinia pestis PY-47]EIS56419.1 hypothetical protein YPP
MEYKTNKKDFCNMRFIRADVRNNNSLFQYSSRITAWSRVFVAAWLNSLN